jgi:hypothetical protein
MEPTRQYSPDDTIPVPPPSRDYEATRPRDTIPCPPPPPSSLSPMSFDLSAEHLDEE